MDWKILAGIFVIGVFLTSGCVEKPDVTTTTTIKTTTTTFKTTTTTFKTTTTTLKSGVHPDYCELDGDCVPAQCCHPTSCVNKKFSPNCAEVMCTMECRGPIDCGAGRCACINNNCVVESSQTS